MCQQDAILFSKLPERISMSKLGRISFIEVSDTISFPHIANYSFQNKLSKGIYKTKTAYWLRACFLNDTDANVLLYFYTGSTQLVNLYAQNHKTKLIYTSSSGTYMPIQYLRDKEIQTYISLPLAINEPVEVFIRLYNLTNRNIKTDLTLEKSNAYFDTIQAKKKSELNETFIIIIFCSSLMFLFLFMSFTYIKNRQRVYLYFCLYLLGAVIYSCTRLSSSTLVGSWINHEPFIRTLLNEPSQFLFFAAYNLFAIELLNIKENDRLLYKILRVLSLIYVLYAIFHFCFIAITHDVIIRDKLFVITRILLFPINGFLIIRTMLTLNKITIYKYFISGVLIYFFGAILAALSDYLFRTTGSYGSYLTSGNIFQIGIMAEALCFAFAIGYRTKLIDDERKEHQENYIDQLKINQEIYEKTNLELEDKIYQRTIEIVAYQKQIQEQKKAELKLIYEKKISELENVALRSQMNPHFLFNSLNAIKFFILSNQNNQAANYLNRFSKLIRLILEHSKESLIDLNNELKALKLYLEIESTRFDDSFSYNIQIDEDVNADTLLVPPLLLQPFVENAIWHGLLPKKNAEKLLQISILKRKENYLFIIEDNGIGRASSNKKKSADKNLRRSFGMQITQERIDLYNNNTQGNIKLKIIDLPANSGTRIEIIYRL